MAKQDPQKDPLAKLISTGKKIRARAKSAKQKRERQDIASEKQRALRVLSRSIVPSQSRTILPTLFYILGLLAAVVIPLWKMNRGWQLVSAIIGLLALTSALFFLWVHLMIRVEKRWLASVPFEFAIDSYKNLMSTSQWQMRLRLFVIFESAPQAALRRQIVAALAGALPDSSAFWSEREPAPTLIVESPIIITKLMNGKSLSAESRYSNQDVHRWFHRCVERYLRLVQEVAPIKRVDVKSDSRI